ncbi:hypothetical protein GCM10022207_64580 [Streptomyces lannensis]|uniref:Secreted protein n=1 Tax=Streptomyces lannensis TaxID=766498 RepID=A0ABP7KYJ2_9ACTN
MQRVVQRKSEVGVRLLGHALLLELLLDLLDLLQLVLHALGDLLARLLTGLLDRLLDDLRDRLLRADLLHGLGSGHHRHECSIRGIMGEADI